MHSLCEPSLHRRRSHAIRVLSPAVLVLLAVFALLAGCSDDRTSPAPLAPEAQPVAANAQNSAVVNGRIAFSALAGGGVAIFSMNPDGTDRRQLTTNPVGDDWDAAVSPDGRKIAFVRSEGTAANVYVMNADGSGVHQLTAFVPGGYAEGPAWSPDGKRIALTGSETGVHSGIYVVSANGHNLAPVAAQGAEDMQPAWAPDGQRIAFTRVGGMGTNIMIADVVAGGSAQLFALCGSIACHAPAWSPDGTRIAYERDGTLQVQPLVGAPQPAAFNLVGYAGGPVWAPDGTKLLFTGTVVDGGSTRIALVTVAPDGAGPQPVSPGPAPEMYPSWGRQR